MKINPLFRKVWCARLISILGTGLTEFGFSVWVYYATGKVTPMAVTMLCAILPSILVAPFSGLICDKYNRKKIIVIADSVAAVTSIVMLIYITVFEFNFGIICFFILVSSTANTFDTNAYQSAITTLVDKSELKTANGLNQLIDSINTIVSPIVAGILYSLIGLKGIIIVDLMSYSISMIIFLQIDRNKFTSSNIQVVKEKEKELWKGFQFIFTQKSLLLLLVYFTILNFLFNISTALIEPFSLSVGSTISLGFIKACGGIGILCGGLFASFYKFKQETYKIICIGILWEGIAVLLMGSTNVIFLIGGGRLLFSLVIPVTNTIAGTLWLEKTPQELQGRVYAARAMIAKLLIPVSYLLVGPLVDRLIPNLIDRRSILIIRKILGMNAIQYRIVFLVIGVLVIILTLGINSSKTFRKLDDTV